MTKEEKYTPSSINDGQRCPECGGAKLMSDYESAEVVCMECGYVLDIKITNQEPEWRAFDAEQSEKRARTGAPATFTIHDQGLSTMIDWQDRDIYGKSFAHGQKAQISRMRKWQRRIRVSNANERNLAFALTEITKVANNLGLPKSIFETASVIYRKALKQHLIRGRSIQGISAASVYIACRQHGLARTLEEISIGSNMSSKEVGRSYRFLVNELEYIIPPVNANQYISKFSNQMSMGGKVEEIANKIFVTASNLKLTSGRGPTGIAAAASYIASVLVGEKRTQREIAEIAKVTEVTIRNRYRELSDKLFFIIEL
jgi:transcription initiation factor TFIIB